ncbi:hypothetical protein BT93_L1941 [Corymbia citriodora subsp. variegata]|uniref:PGG domain-containing protein n=1 Tax=Corymbia citriodora subsp. variegata TaxID=360336 RepID=A0A8T0CMJ8_CORYI|nr:hypothetical protein BT93_L1941 [Corymbia citriodora subsp. variegata]
MERSETRGTPNERLEVLKARYVSTPDNQHQLEDGDLNKIMDRELYEATKKGNVEEFINALEKVSESRKLALSLIFYQVTPSGNSLLHVAASSGNDDVVEFILNHFPNTVTHRNSSEDTPLHVAIQDRRLDTIEKIICLGTDSEIIYLKNKNDESPLYLAIEKCTWSECQDREGAGWGILQLLLEAFARDEAYAVKIQGKSPVFAAIKKMYTELLREIIDRLPKLLHVRDSNRWTPLHYAASEGNNEAVELLLEKCPYLALQTDKNGSYPIHIASERSWSGVIDPLLKDTWPDLAEIKNNKGQNILHVAVKAGNHSGVKSILKECGETNTEKMVNSRDVDGNTPLHLASIHNHCYVMYFFKPLLKDTWSDLAEIKNNKGQNILHVAAKARNDFGVYWILKECGETNTEKLVNSRDVDGNTPLHLASIHNHCDVMRILTKEKRIYLKSRNNDGLTALDAAMESKSLSTENPALIGRAILIVAGVPQSGGRDVMLPREQHSEVSKSSPAKWIKDQVNILLLVATLVASVTFTAGVTLPGGYNASSDPHPGTATMLHHRMFRVFVIANMLAMYSSILAVVVLLWGFNRDFYVAELAYHLAGPLLLMALAGMSVAFFAAITVAVSKLTWLGSLVMSVGVLFLVMVVVVLAALIFPSSKSTMYIVVFYYIVITVVEKFVDVVRDFVEKFVGVVQDFVDVVQDFVEKFVDVWARVCYSTRCEIVANTVSDQ